MGLKKRRQSKLKSPIFGTSQLNQVNKWRMMMSRYAIFRAVTGMKARYATTLRSILTAGQEESGKYVETCTFSGAVFFSAPASFYRSGAVLNDRNAEIAFLYRVLSDSDVGENALKQILEIENPGGAEGLQAFNEAKSRVRDADLDAIWKSGDTDRISLMAAYIYILYSQSFNCSGEAYRKKGATGQHYKRMVANTMGFVFEKLQAVQPEIRCQDVISVVREFKNDPSVTIFCDPPYVGQYRRHRSDYRIEMNDIASHIRLAQELNECRGNVVLCGFRAPEGMPTVYDGYLDSRWSCLLLGKHENRAKVMCRDQKNDAPDEEFIWTNVGMEHLNQPGISDRISLKNYKEAIDEKRYWQEIRESLNVMKIADRQEYEDAYEKLYGAHLLV